MRHLLAWSAALFLLAPTGPARAAGENDPFRDDGSIRYRFYTDIELFYVERDDTPDVEVSYEIDGASIRDRIGTDDVVDDDEEFGGRALLGFRLNATSSLEAVYMGWGHEDSETQKQPLAQDLFAFEFPDLGGSTFLDDNNFDEAAAHDLEYDEDFYSGELNYRHALEVPGADYRFNLLAGLRVIRLEENLAFTSFDENGPPGPPLGPGDIGKFDIATRNTLIGGQLGVETFIPLWRDRLDLDVLAVAGGYANQAQVRLDYLNADSPQGPGDTFRESRTEWDAAGVFEAAAHLKIRLWRGVRMRLGYRAVYMVGIAAAPEQFPRSGSAGDFFGNTYDNDGTTVFHGPSVGLGVDF